MLAVSRSFSALMSASSDGQVLLWDLNRSELVRQLTTGRPVEVSVILSWSISRKADCVLVRPNQRRDWCRHALSSV
jgi:WD40 repeat protein